MDEVEVRQLRIGAPAAAMLLATVLLSAAITYNALWRQARPELTSTATIAAGEPLGQGSTRIVVDLDQPQPTTVTLRYDPIVEAVQRELAAYGIYNGPVDGVSGRRTQLAILAYQRMQGLEPTGIPNPALVDHIQLTRRFAEAADMTGSLSPDATSAR
jgi:peptidoglycan hydrolase-like protein with peptidoglycan-binding domain